ncbi:YnbE-like lipoprotein [Novosphingobium sp. CF614]|uniref:YnbE family lipoprotein n=1 Tax=Novosphingobium sp. CF614 TaxID=1884364 RepID=UPI0008ED0F21|nr:YnbE family lipoprotein [Novosphingobium sp. CF614]SFG33056.1 YnbE-like lipoprotein [Novosphingobium sp. CF614]
MTAHELTGSFPAATSPQMTRRGMNRVQRESQGPGGRAVRALLKPVLMLMVAGASGALGGCVNLAAPDKPIVIELNINIRQDVVYRLDADAAKTIEQNRDVF